LAGGRNFVGNSTSDGRAPTDWKYFDTIWTVLNNRLQQIGTLPEAMSDMCLVISNLLGKKYLWVIGGSTSPQRYKATVYRTNLDAATFTWEKMLDMPESRMWHRCVSTTIAQEKGILVIGGYYNGGSSMWLPLVNRHGASLETFGLNFNQPKWEWMSSLVDAKKWGAAAGIINGVVTLAGGGDYGSDSIETLAVRDFRASSLKLIQKREFTAGVVVPSEWFPQCQ